LWIHRAIFDWFGACGVSPRATPTSKRLSSGTPGEARADRPAATASSDNTRNAASNSFVDLVRPYVISLQAFRGNKFCSLRRSRRRLFWQNNGIEFVQTNGNKARRVLATTCGLAHEIITAWPAYKCSCVLLEWSACRRDKFSRLGSPDNDAPVTVAFTYSARAICLQSRGRYIVRVVSLVLRNVGGGLLLKFVIPMLHRCCSTNGGAVMVMPQLSRHLRRFRRCSDGVGIRCPRWKHDRRPIRFEYVQHFGHAVVLKPAASFCRPLWASATVPARGLNFCDEIQFLILALVWSL